MLTRKAASSQEIASGFFRCAPPGPCRPFPVPRVDLRGRRRPIIPSSQRWTRLLLGTVLTGGGDWRETVGEQVAPKGRIYRRDAAENPVRKAVVEEKRRFAQKKRVTNLTAPVRRSRKGWAVKRLGVSLDAVTLEYVESHRARLGSLTQSELVRDLLREHRMISPEVLRLREQVAVLSEQLRLLQEL